MISDEAVEAAAVVLCLYVSDEFDAADKDGRMTRDAAKEILDAAAPYIITHPVIAELAANIWDEGKAALYDELVGRGEAVNPYRSQA